MRLSTPHTAFSPTLGTEMPFHQYSRLFTSGLLSEPSPHSSSMSAPPLPRRHTLSLKPANPESTKPADPRSSFLELVDPLTSPLSPTDPSSPRRSLGHCAVSVATNSAATRKPEPVPLRRAVLTSTSLNATVPSPTDTFPHLSLITRPAGQSIIMTESPLPDSPTLARGPSLRTLASTSTSSASLSIKSETKRINRSAALACLEGQERSSTRTPRKSHPNFMSMSDDEDEDDSFAPSRRPSLDRQKLPTITPSNIPSGGEKEVEPLSSDLIVASSPQQSKMAPVRSRHRSRTIESWFPPLANFIDLRNEEEPPNWRSFIELSTATA